MSAGSAIRACAFGALLLAGHVPLAYAATPTCVLPEQKISWPVGNPVWEFCWVAYGDSAGPRGSGLDLRNVHLNGRLLLKQAHAPMLFAEYQSSTCYRDWKDDPAQTLAEPAVRNVIGVSTVFNATTSCDRSQAPTTSYGTCPYQLPGRTAADCFTGVAFEDKGDHLLVTAQYDAAWYMYSSRFAFYRDGSFEPEFGFGNSNGTSNGTTHWHHNYWRLDFAIEGDANDQILENGVVQTTEFARLRCNASTNPACQTERTWSVRDSVTGRGFELLPTADDYVTPTNQSGRNFHLVDVLGTVYQSGEYADSQTNDLGDCSMDHPVLANGGDLDGANGAGTDVVLWYRVGVRDLANTDVMICKKAGPAFRPLGDWGFTLFQNGFE
jgi:hypothetical protein